MLAIELVRLTVIRPEHDLGECVARVVASPTACRRVLQEMARLAAGGELQMGDPRWQPAIDAVGRFADALCNPPVVPSRSRFER